MSALSLWVAILLTADGAAAPGTKGPCFLPSDQTPGWKLVAIPAAAPALAAPEDVEQFRSDEPVWLSDSDLRHYLGASDAGAGKRTFEVELPPGTRKVELEFQQPLRGAKVDAEAMLGVRSFPLMSEKRVPGALLELELPPTELNRAFVTVHHHLRDSPVLLRVRLVQRVLLADDAKVAGPFKVAHALYFRHPGGRTVELCHAPGRRLQLDRLSLEGARPASVSLAPR